VLKGWGGVWKKKKGGEDEGCAKEKVDEKKQKTKQK
jgi:hypothetical protein